MKTKLRIFHKLLLTTSILFFIATHGTLAQPTFNFKSISVNWPQVTLRIQAHCNGVNQYGLKEDNFVLKENGERIDSFQVFCPDTNSHCCLSVAFVIDRSESMGWPGISGLDGAKASAKAFVDAMIDTCDEAALVSYASTTTLDVPMTTNKISLKMGIDALYAGGVTNQVAALDTALNEIINKGTRTCRSIIFLTDGVDSLLPYWNGIWLASGLGIRIYTIALGTGADDSTLNFIAQVTGGIFYKVPAPWELVDIYKQIYKTISLSFDECTIEYTSKCMDGTRRDVELTLYNLPSCSGSVASTRNFKAPKDTSTYIPITISLGHDTVKGGQFVSIPLMLETPINEKFYQANFNLLFDETCAQFIKLDTHPYLLDSTAFTVQPIPGGMHIAFQNSKIIQRNWILAMLTFKVSDPDSLQKCLLKLTNWIFKAGCLQPTLKSGEIVILPRQPKIECTMDMPNELIYDKSLNDYTPSPFIVQHIIKNVGDRELRNAVATIQYNKNEITLVSPLSNKQPYVPKTVAENGGMAVARWDLFAKKRTTGDSIEICISCSSDNYPTFVCCRKIWIPPTQSIINCKLSAPKIGINAAKDRYIPMPFILTADISNDGGLVSDSLIATINFTPDLKLTPIQNNNGTKVVSPYKLFPGQHGTVSWELVHPLVVDQKDYIVTVCIRQKNIDSTCCEIPITIPALGGGTILSCYGKAPNNFIFDSSKSNYTPNPFDVTIGIINTSGEPADSVRATIIFPSDLVLDPPNQPLTKFFNPMKIEKWQQGMPPNEISWQLRTTKLFRSKHCDTVRFKIEGNIVSGPFDPVFCCACFCLPAIPDPLSCQIYGPDSLVLNKDKTGVVPNPFMIRSVIKNIGVMPIKIKESRVVVTNDIIVISSNPVYLNKVLNPGDSVSVVWTVQVIKYSRMLRPLRICVVTVDENDNPLECCKYIPITPVEVALSCFASGPDTIHFDPILKIHRPNPFIGYFGFFNSGTSPVNNVVVEIDTLPPEISLFDFVTKKIATIPSLNTVQLNWSMLLSSLGLSLKVGKQVRIGVHYSADSLATIYSDCYFDVFIEANPLTEVKSKEKMPSSFILEQNYPNPFSTSTTISFNLSSPRRVFDPTLSLNKERETIGKHRATLKVFDVFGREVLDLSDRIINNWERRTGNCELTIDNSPSANQLKNPGVYFYRLTVGNESQTRMMMRVK